MKGEIKAILDGLTPQVEAIDKLKPRTQSVDDASIKLKAAIRLLGNVEAEAAGLAQWEKDQQTREQQLRK